MTRSISIVLAFSATFLFACNPISKQAKEDMAKPVNCATAQGDLRVLRSEKGHVGSQIAAGITSVTPAGAVLGILTGTEGDKLEYAIGEYDHEINQKMDLIKRTCGIE